MDPWNSEDRLENLKRTVCKEDESVTEKSSICDRSYLLVVGVL